MVTTPQEAPQAVSRTKKTITAFPGREIDDCLPLLHSIGDEHASLD